MGWAPHASEYGAHFFAGEHDGQVLTALRSRELLYPRRLHIQDLGVQEYQGAEGLLVARCTQAALAYAGAEKLLDRVTTEFTRVATLVKIYEAARSGHIRTLGSRAVVPQRQLLPQSLEQSGLHRAGNG